MADFEAGREIISLGTTNNIFYIIADGSVTAKVRGHEITIKKGDIVGIFDLDTTTVMKSSRNFINKASKEGNVITVSFELPKAFVVTRNKKETKKSKG